MELLGEGLAEVVVEEAADTVVAADASELVEASQLSISKCSPCPMFSVMRLGYDE
jgi:hypothetical protein